MATRSYKDAIDCLNSLQSNAAHLEAAKAAGNRNTATAIPLMVEYLERIGYKQTDLNKLNVIHVTGTKGKGSTCAFTDSVLRHAQPEWKVGLFTSPHLVSVRERIRINGVPLSEDDFANFFFYVWDKLRANTKSTFPSASPMPMYFKFLTLVAFHAFLSLQVNATILEVGVGGRYDSTNIIQQPVVTGVSALGIDHTTVLGKTIQEIAWQKAGIFKEGVPAVSVDQPKEAMEVLLHQANELKTSTFHIAHISSELTDIELGLAGTHQVHNAALAVALVQTFLQVKAAVNPNDALPIQFKEGLIHTKWPGRCQTVPDQLVPGMTWFLDGAHTIESLDCCMEWFVDSKAVLRKPSTSMPTTRVLMFNCTHGRSGARLLEVILTKATEQFRLHAPNDDATRLFDHTIFCSNVTYADGHFKGDLNAVGIPEDELIHLTVQHELATVWKNLLPDFPLENIHVLPSIEHAVRVIKQFHEQARGIDVLVTGSLHLVGGLIEVAGLSDVAL